MKIYQQFKAALEKRHLWMAFTYLFFGGLATVVNIISFALAHRQLALSWPIANFISWLAAVLFAFVTNKYWVFHTVTESFGAFLWEFIKFMVARVLSLGLDMFTMWVIIDVLAGSDLVAKIITQVLVVIVNYVFSKVLIFTATKERL